jgi:hypothetical protein
MKMVTSMHARKYSNAIAVRQLLLAGLLAGSAANAFAGDAMLDPVVVQRLQTSMSYLGGLQQFSLVTETSIEVVMESGQKLQFDTAVDAQVKRPDKLLAVRKGELLDQKFYYDGKTLTLQNPDSGVYATVDAPPTLDGVLDFARESLDIVAPAGDFFYSNAFEILMDGVHTAFQVGQAEVGGVLCDHLAFRADHVDWQIWIEQGARPLPRKLVLTSPDVLNAPQFSVLIREWNLQPNLTDEMFRFTPPDGAVAIGFVSLEGDSK